MWFLAGVSAHVDDEHVLCFEWLLLANTALPLADEQFLVRRDVITIHMLKQAVTWH